VFFEKNTLGPLGVNIALGLKPISASTKTHLQQVEFSECKIESRGYMFARCGICKNKGSLPHSYFVGLTNYTILDKAYKTHLAK
jgi:hypothetical protein